MLDFLDVPLCDPMAWPEPDQRRAGRDELDRRLVSDPVATAIAVMLGRIGFRRARLGRLQQSLRHEHSKQSKRRNSSIPADEKPRRNKRPA